jgi:hypothetical protein
MMETYATTQQAGGAAQQQAAQQAAQQQATTQAVAQQAAQGAQGAAQQQAGGAPQATTQAAAPKPAQADTYHVCPVGYKQKKGNASLCPTVTKQGEMCPTDDTKCCEKESAVAFRWIGIVLLVIFVIAYIVTLVNQTNDDDVNSIFEDWTILKMFVPVFKKNEGDWNFSYTIPAIIFLTAIIVLPIYIAQAFANDGAFKDVKKCEVEVPHNFPHGHDHSADKDAHSHGHSHTWLEQEHDHDHGHLPPNTMFALFGGEQ